MTATKISDEEIIARNGIKRLYLAGIDGRDWLKDHPVQLAQDKGPRLKMVKIALEYAKKEPCASFIRARYSIDAEDEYKVCDMLLSNKRFVYFLFYHYGWNGFRSTIERMFGSKTQVSRKIGPNPFTLTREQIDEIHEKYNSGGWKMIYQGTSLEQEVYDWIAAHGGHSQHGKPKTPTPEPTPEPEPEPKTAEPEPATVPAPEPTPEPGFIVNETALNLNLKNIWGKVLSHEIDNVGEYLAVNFVKPAGATPTVDEIIGKINDAKLAESLKIIVKTAELAAGKN